MIKYIDGKRIVARAITFIDNKVLLIERYRREGEELLHYFTIPGGGVEDDEEYSETAIRETKEETCCDIEIIEYLTEEDYGSGICHWYYAKYISGTPTLGGEENGKNHLFLLFDHIYSGLRFRFKVDTKYDDLRTIVLKKVELKSADMYEKYDCTITLTADTPTPISSLTFTPTSVTPPETNNYMSYATIFNGALYSTPTPGYPGGIVLQKGTYTDLMGCFLPHETDIFTLKCTYDVYDKQGNRIRQNCTAENELNLDIIFDNLQVVLVRGTYYIVNLTVAPTYLYVLSEPDLDNPTIVVN